MPVMSQTVKGRDLTFGAESYAGVPRLHGFSYIMISLLVFCMLPPRFSIHLL